MKHIRFWIFAIIGFSFWFILGFPFAHHHESFEWATQIQDVKLMDTMFLTTGHFISYRPLGQFAAVVLYRVFENSLAPVQLYNYLLTITAWFILILAIKDKRFMSLISLAAGGVLFVSFMYLFHLHGIYYSHLLLFLSLLIYMEMGELTNKKFVMIFIMTLFASLFHAFALWIFIAFLLGKSAEQWKNLSKIQFFIGSVMVLTAFIFYIILVPNDLNILNLERLGGQYLAYLKLEVNALVSFFLISLILLSGATIKLAKRSQLIFLSTILIVSIVFFVLNLPLISVWIFVCLLKLVMTKRYALTGILLMSSHFMLFTGTRSAHLSIIVVMICITIVSLDWSKFESKLKAIDQKFNLYVSAVPVLVCLILVVLKLDVQVPVVSKLAHPMLEKKEISEQITKIIDWYMISAFKGYELIVDECYNMSQDHQPKKKVFLAPVSNHALNDYIQRIGKFDSNNLDVNNRLFVCFGNSGIENGESIYTVKGKYAGDAHVYLSVME
jgi:hypothetical protein